MPAMTTRKKSASPPRTALPIPATRETKPHPEHLRELAGDLAHPELLRQIVEGEGQPLRDIRELHAHLRPEEQEEAE
jgi:hypothetical protein